MAKNNKNKKNMLDIPAVAIIDNIVFSKTEVWAYYKVSTVPFDFLSNPAKVNIANSTMTALSSLAQTAGQKVDCHLLITNTPFDVSSWEEQMVTIYDEWNQEAQRSNTFERFIDEQADILRHMEYKKRVTYLGVKLYSRGAFSIDNFNILEFGFKEAYETLKKSVSDLFALPSEELTDYDVKKAKNSEKEINRILSSGSMTTHRVSAEELLLLIKKNLHPAMPSPYLEVDHGQRLGLSDIAIESGAVIENHHRHLRVTQMIEDKEYEGYRATLSFSKFPKLGMGMPSNVTPFMYMPTKLGLPFTMNSRFSLIPTETVRKDLSKRELETKDELKNLAGSGQGSNPHIEETLYNQQVTSQAIMDDKMPWVSGSYRVTIEMPTLDLLSTAAAELKQEYADEDVTLTWTSGDQLEFLMEEMPGGTLRVGSFNQMTNLAMIGTSGFNFGGTVGDPINEKLILSKKSKRRGGR